jgi:RNA polymerase sigma factor (sigma-70 family)
MVGRGCRLDANELDEFVQDVMMDFFNAQQKFVYQPEKGRFRDYFLRIVRNRLYARFRARKRRDARFEALPDEGSDEIPDSRVSELEAVWEQEWRSHVLREALLAVKRSPAVTARALQVFDLWETQDVPPKEIAKALGISLASVYNDRNRVLDELRRIVKELDEGAVSVPRKESPA